MSGDKSQRRTLLSWIYVAPLFILCGILGVLQYRMIGQVRDAARDRLHGSLQASLNRVSQEVDSEIATAGAAIVPAMNDDPTAIEQQLREHYEQWKQSSRHSQMFRRVALAVPQGTSLEFRSVEPDSEATQDWPASLQPLEQRLDRTLLSRLNANPDSPGAPPPPDMSARRDNEGLGMEYPMFGVYRDRLGRGPGPGGLFARREVAWVILELNPDYLRSTMLPEILQRHLGTGGNLDYQVWVLDRANPQDVIYASDPGRPLPARNADAMVTLFDPQWESMFRRGGFGGRGRGMGPGTIGGRGPTPGEGRWQLYVRHRAGSLEAVVSRARLLNLAVTGGVLLLMLATLAALISYIRRAQRLTELQMEFVTGVSHELRTPLTVIHTAGYNLRGKLSTNPAQVEKYGALIQQESGRLKELVEQVLQFSSAKAGRVIQDREPLSVESVIEQALESSKALIAGAHCTIEKTVQPGLPPILGDPMALRQALANLVGNAAKYGSTGSKWIGISATGAGENGSRAVAISVADHGPGIPSDEQAHIFDPFFRGARAVQDQIHGTGLGLSLVKKIVEAHGGTIRVKSEPMKGAEFIVTLPAISAEAAG
jgi:signal transduction histidine kinase